MKKQILLTLVTPLLAMLTVSSAFAESEITRLQRVKTESCETSELAKAITATADNVLYSEKKVTVLEESLGITTSQKEAGTIAKVLGSYPRSSVAAHSKTVTRAEADAAQGKVGVTAPALFDVVYAVQDASGAQIGEKGRVSIAVTCRVEKSGDKIARAASLLSFDVKPKGTK
ncbi:MAG: hypothetical protein V4654_01665 [Bdellovibrionota bacterium]